MHQEEAWHSVHVHAPARGPSVLPNKGECLRDKSF